MAAVLCCNPHEFRYFLRTFASDKAVALYRISPKRVSSTLKGNDTKSGTSKYKNTVHLPKTNFPLWLNPRLRPQHDRDIMQKCRFASLYEWQRNTLKGEDFVLHDGPPYANGAPHVGHVVNKVLKDIIMRDELLNGIPIHYKPGWDCHGLPIELKALKSSGGGTLTPAQVREKARSYAQDAIEVQRSAFQSWGILGDWKNKCYYTFSNEYIKKQFNSFYTLLKKGLIYRDYKPVHWSPSTRTALAESELVYNDNHKSQCVIVRFHLKTPPFSVNTDKPVYALIWTTTPWTLPGNEAVMYRSNIEYSAVEIENHDECYIIADKLVPVLSKKLGKEVKVLNKFLGKALKRATYFHPFHKEEVHRFFEADHVADDKGTGLVHCAPGHGREDYAVGVVNNLPAASIADQEGNFSEAAGTALAGKSVLGEGTNAVIELLQPDIILSEELTHSYPYDWRTNEPVITLASRQWFFDCTSVKDAAISEIQNLKFAPERYSVKNMAQVVKDRPFWCISRQRVWGVPIPVLFKRECTKPIISQSLIEHYCNLLDTQGSDFWWSLPIEELFPPTLAYELGIEPHEIERCTDILDIWFDSGLSWLAAIDGRTADLCLEGVDQFNGWFQSSLLTSIALQGKSPYKKIFSHGFVVDEEGHKMSKSVGNVIDPQEIILGGKNFDKQPPYGVDTLRWWVASHSVQHSNIPISIPLIKASSEVLQKLRGSLRYTLGALSDFKKSCADNISDDELFLIDRFMLHAMYELQRDIQQLYKKHEYNTICRSINDFVVNDVSALYITITKDRLYCDLADSSKRRSCQYVLSQILDFLLRSIAPIAPLLVEETYLHHPFRSENNTYFEHQSQHPFAIHTKWHSASVADSVEAAIEVKSIVNKELKSGHSWESDVIVHCSKETYDRLKPLVENQTPTESQLAELLQVGSVELKPSFQEEGSLEQPLRCTLESTLCGSPLCSRCRRHRSHAESDLCSRCNAIIQSSSNSVQQASL